MRILLAVHQFPPEAVAGTELQAWQMAAALAPRHSVTVFTRSHGRGAPATRLEPHPAGFTVCRVTAPAAPTLRATIQDPGLTAEFIRCLDQVQPDVVHIHHLERLSLDLPAACRARGIPVVITLHDFWFICPQVRLLFDGSTICPGPDGGDRCARCRGAIPAGVIPEYGGVRRRDYFRARFERSQSALGLADLVFSPTRCLADRFRQADCSVPIEIQPYGLDPGFYRSAPQRDPRRAGAIRFVCPGVVAPHKGTDLFVRAARAGFEPNTEFAVYGHGEPWFIERVRQRMNPHWLDPDNGEARRFGARVRQLRSVPRLEYRGGYLPDEGVAVAALADAVVVPSVWLENSPLAILEARLARTPVIAAAIGGIPELVRDGTDGWLFPSGDPAGLARLFQRLARQPELLAAARHQAPVVPTMESVVTALETRYRELPARPRPVPGSGGPADFPRVAAGDRFRLSALIPAAAARCRRRPPAPWTGSEPAGTNPAPAPKLISVIIPVGPGENRLGEILPLLHRRPDPPLLEFLLIDSGLDGPERRLAEAAGMTIIPLPPGTFNHGAARNLGARAARGDLLLFLNADAVPVDERFLPNLLRVLREHPAVAGVTARQLPPDGPGGGIPLDPFRARDLLAGPGSRVTAPVIHRWPGAPAWARLGLHERRRLAAFETVAGLVRREWWERIPFRELAFGEDLDWGLRVLGSGGALACQPAAAVSHAHGFYGSARANFSKHRDDGRLLASCFGRAPELALPQLLGAAVRALLLDWYWIARTRDGLSQRWRWMVPAPWVRLVQALGTWRGARAAGPVTAPTVPG